MLGESFIISYSGNQLPFHSLPTRHFLSYLSVWDAYLPLFLIYLAIQALHFIQNLGGYVKSGASMGPKLGLA